MKYQKPKMQTYTMEQVSEAIGASACGSVTGSCYGASNCGCSYGKSWWSASHNGTGHCGKLLILLRLIGLNDTGVN